MRATISLAQRTVRAATTRSKSTTTTTTTTRPTTRASPLPYAPSQAQQNNPPSTHLDQQISATNSPSRPPLSSHTPQPRRGPVNLNSPEYKAAASKYTRAMIAMPILLLTSYVLYGRFTEGEEAKSVRGKGGEARIVVLDR